MTEICAKNMPAKHMFGGDAYPGFRVSAQWTLLFGQEHFSYLKPFVKPVTGSDQ